MAAYRDTFRVGSVHERRGISPAKLRIEDLDASVIVGFLDHLEVDRHNTARTRNTRLAAIRSLFRYAALRHPGHAELIQQVARPPPEAL